MSKSPGDTRGPLSGDGRFFSIDQILYDTGYTAAKTLFVASLDQQNAPPLDLSESLVDKGASALPQGPKPEDFGLLPLPYTLEECDGPSRFQMDFHKLVVLGVPHALQNSSGVMTRPAKAMSFKHICSVLKHFYELCESIQKAAKLSRKQHLGQPHVGGQDARSPASRQGSGSD